MPVIPKLAGTSNSNRQNDQENRLVLVGILQRRINGVQNHTKNISQGMGGTATETISGRRPIQNLTAHDALCRIWNFTDALEKLV